ncbi:Fic family protein [Mucilaginibacter psychrotolerans]|uniref:Cell filamentation protein Fic n=1 Tax=Mucilaginibacter psychrotolerans TaxID=1524096 RepID=A0A4Y8S706_9SPHI|nr:Fic family protein [Mucilaginibacter psychrotolerans]TFF34536.1 cell filamentation protein Fic [Mucilaginibacter psychrotolerans]
MATPREKLAEALHSLKKLQDTGEVALHTSELPNEHRKLLVKQGFLKEISKGWYIPADPQQNPGDSTAWYSSYWEFFAKFLENRYGSDWSISPEQSLLIHAGNWSVPTQLIVRSAKANNTPMQLPHHSSLFNLKAEFPEDTTTVINGIRMYLPQAALVYSSPAIFVSNPIDARTALSMIRDASELLPLLLDNGHTRIAGRLAGAFRNIGREQIGKDIIDAMKSAGFDTRESDPFSYQLDVELSSRERSPQVNRIKLIWKEMRELVIANFPKAPGLPKEVAAYIKKVDDIYVTDAYHSLSIERYRVTPELIERVRSGEWDKDENKEDKQQKDAMAARGYWQAFQEVKTTIHAILNGSNPGKQLYKDHSKWYRELFDPSVAAGILRASDLAGYRNNQVYIGGSKHVPLSVDAMRDVMPIFFELLEQEPEASVRAVLGHFIFVFIHPYMDGNGRIGRFLMNAMLASGGYPWTVIPVEKRTLYMEALEKASAEQDIKPFVTFLAHLVELGMQGHPEAHI